MIKASPKKLIFAKTADGSYGFIDINQYNSKIAKPRNVFAAKKTFKPEEQILPAAYRELNKLKSILQGQGCNSCKKKRGH
jgi:hypothetical protein